MKPLLSVITITYNAEKYLQETIDSVARQTYPFIEYIIIDGKSTDGTLRIVNQNMETINHWISEEDEGIADAMNKGLKKVTGDYVLFLHSDDYLVDETSIAEAVKHLDGDHDIFAFSILFQIENHTKHQKIPSWDLRFNLKTKLLHQGVLCRKGLFNSLGVFDTQLRIAMDYDFFLRAYRKKCKVKIIRDITLSVMRDTGVSSRCEWYSLSARLQEEKKVHFNNSTYFMRLIYHVYWFLYFPYKKLSSLWHSLCELCLTIGR